MFNDTLRFYISRMRQNNKKNYEIRGQNLVKLRNNNLGAKMFQNLPLGNCNNI